MSKKRIRKEIIRKSGVTADGQPVMAGFFKFVDGQGIPLDILLDWCVKRGVVPDWIDFFTEAIKRGWNIRSTLTRIETACSDVYDSRHAKIVVDKLKSLQTSVEVV